MTSEERPLYERDRAAWREHLAEGNSRQARKRVGADALIRNGRGEILLVDPSYKPDWDLPGGMAEQNEPPHQAAERELREELGLELSLNTMLVVDWVAPHGPWDDSLMFVFDGGILDDRQIASLHVADPEIRAFEFVSVDQAATLLRPYVWKRLDRALAAGTDGTAGYLHTSVHDWLSG
ncbi:NUDIX hydrolase [Plantactinospora sp. BB1]|uniref:NUDIX domain-containing protein n=1 Tax=Plantactinospora sp. BB1 TaxID=2071627 RepID=UPI000D163B78|nr:NUDIX hydrolase [Plantactinospora sp. BB1]AVT35825.1 NUDIX hydrolase [Plantactinospora sp. BB1]